jgi:hypothetical protein
MIDRAVFMDIHAGTPYPDALDLPMSLSRAYFDSKVHTQHQKAEEGRQRNLNVVLQRIDGVIKAIGELGKALAGRR